MKLSGGFNVLVGLSDAFWVKNMDFFKNLMANGYNVNNNYGSAGVNIGQNVGVQVENISSSMVNLQHYSDTLNNNYESARVNVGQNLCVQAKNITNSVINVMIGGQSSRSKKCLWFVAKQERGLRYNDMKKRCAAEARAFSGETVGYPAFFRNKEEYEQYRNLVGNRKEYLGYEQQGGDNNKWLNADGTEVTFTDWDLDWKPQKIVRPQPERDSEACAMTGWRGQRDWHDVRCNNQIGAYYSCRFEQKSGSS